VYRALAVAVGKLSRGHRADLTETAPADVIDPDPQWGEPERIVCLDRLGATVADVFSAELAAGLRHPPQRPGRRRTPTGREHRTRRAGRHLTGPRAALANKYLIRIILSASASA
jgi:GTP cyclohydrolase N terminal